MIGDVVTAAAVGYLFTLLLRGFRRNLERKATEDAREGADLIRAAESGSAQEPMRRCASCGVVCLSTVEAGEGGLHAPEWRECPARTGVYHYEPREGWEA